MEVQYFDSFTLLVIFGGVGVIVVGFALRQIESMQKNIPIWLVTGLLGVLVGSGASMLALHAIGYHWVPQPLVASGTSDMPPGPSMSGPMGGMGGGGMPGMGGGGGMPGMGGGGGMPGMGGGGGAAPRSRRDLTTMVGKLDLASGGVQLQLSDEQIVNLREAIKLLDDPEEMNEDSAKGHLEAIEAILTSEQKATLASFELPRPARASGAPGGPGGGRGGMAPGGMAAVGAVSSAGMAGGGPPGAGGPGGAQASDENPFKSEENAKRLHSLRGRIGAPVPAGNGASPSTPERSGSQRE